MTAPTPDALRLAWDRLSRAPAFKKAQWVGLRFVEDTINSRLARDGRMELDRTQRSQGVFLEALVDGQFAYAATSRLAPEALELGLEQAVAAAKKASPHRLWDATADLRPPAQGRHQYLGSLALDAVPAAEIQGLLVRITERIKSQPEMLRSTATFANTVRHQRLLSSSGSDLWLSDQWASVYFDATAQHGSVVQTRSNGGGYAKSYRGGAEWLIENHALWTQVEAVASQARELAAAKPCPEGKRDLLLLPDQMALQIHESIGHPLEMDRILGDERNFAGTSFVREADLGTLIYGTPLLNVSFDPTISHELASSPFDDLGVPSQKAMLIEEGILRRGLTGIESGARSGQPWVANSRASIWQRPAIDRMANLNLEPGTSTLEKMIASVDHGILMTSNVSWSIDDRRENFQFGCEWGQLIEKGKVTQTVRDPGYRGRTLPFWRSLLQVGDASTFGVHGVPTCGKGEPNQVIRVGHASPPALFGKVEVFGGAHT